MDWFIYFLVFVFGSLIGSFLNVVVSRYNSGLSPLRGRSICFSCGVTIDWYHMVPIISFLILKGRCSGCESKISLRYLFMEILSGLLFLLVFWRFGFSFDAIFYSIVFSILLIIATYDFRHKIIPDGLVYAFVAIVFLKMLSIAAPIGTLLTPQFFTGIFIFLFFGVMWLVSGGRWMGFGDAKLGLGIGWLFPVFCDGIFAIMLSFLIGAAVGLAIIAANKLTGAGTIVREVPFAPFMVLAAFLVVLIQYNYCGLIFGLSF